MENNGYYSESYVVHVTRRCNMKCLYCYERNIDFKEDAYELEDVKSYIDNLIKFRTQDDFTIEFLGGEPMLAWDIIQGIYEYIETEYNNVVKIPRYTITTNGTIINPHVVRYLQDNKKIHFAISLDGNRWSNQLRIMKKNNDNSYYTVMQNIKTLLENGIDPSIHIVTHLYNIPFLEESIEHLYEKGIRSIGIGTIESTMIIDDEYCETFLEQLDNVSKKIIRGELKGLSIGLFDSVKPLEDVRTYIKDEKGRVLGETYGRAGDDISKKDDIYNINRCDNQNENNITKKIYFIRKKAYLNHLKNQSAFSGDKDGLIE